MVEGNGGYLAKIEIWLVHVLPSQVSRQGVRYGLPKWLHIFVNRFIPRPLLVAVS